jgi:hypothetical protein
MFVESIQPLLWSNTNMLLGWGEILTWLNWGLNTTLSGGGQVGKINNPQGGVGLVKYGRGGSKKRLGGCGAGKKFPNRVGGVPWWWVKSEGSGVWHGKNNQTWAVVGGKKVAGMGKKLGPLRQVEGGYGDGGGGSNSPITFSYPPPQLPKEHQKNPASAW